MSTSSNITRLIEDLGRVRAEGVAAQGQIFGNAVGSIAQLPTQIATANRAAQDEALRQRLTQNQIAVGDQQITAGAQQAKDTATVDRLWADPGVFNPDGTINRQGVQSRLKDAGHLVPAVMEHADKLDASRLELGQKSQALYAAQQDTLAKERARIEANGNDPGMFALSVAALSRPDVGIIPKQQADQWVNAQTPEQVASVLKTWPQVKREYKEVGKGASLVDVTPGQTPAVVAGGGPEPADVERERHNQAMEGIAKMTAGREAAQAAETARHNRATEAANNPLAALTGASGTGGAPKTATQAEGVHGDDFLRTLPPNVAGEVKAYAEGRRPFPAGFALKSPYFQSLIQMVGQYDPTFDAVNYNARSKTRNDFTSGKSAQTINALNTVTQHMNVLSDAADALNNSSLPAYNSIANLVSKATGNPQVTRFETAKKAVTDELTRAWRQAGGSEQDIKSWSEVLNASESPAQLHGAIAQMGTLLEGKLSALENQYQQGMGTTDTTGMNVVSPAARATLDKLEKRAGGAVAPAAPAGRMRVVGPNGETGTVPEGATLPAGWKKG